MNTEMNIWPEEPRALGKRAFSRWRCSKTREAKVMQKDKRCESHSNDQAEFITTGLSSSLWSEIIFKGIL